MNATLSGDIVRGAKIISLFGFAGIVAAIWAVLGVLTNTLDNSWYLVLNKPAWLPSDIVLELVWTVLYSLIAISGWKVWNCLPVKGFSEKVFHRVMIPYWSQLILDLAWSILFFGMREPILASFDIVLLLLLIFVNILSFASVNKTASLMLVPYFIWVCYATTLSIGFAVLN